MTAEIREYYVYQFKYKGEILYVGSGKKDRINHVLSGTSNSKYLNQFTLFGYDEELAIVEKVKTRLTQEKSLELEYKLIREIRPIFNLLGVRNHSRHEADLYIEQHRFSHIFRTLEWKESKTLEQRYQDEMKRVNEYSEILEVRIKELLEINKKLEDRLNTPLYRHL